MQAEMAVEVDNAAIAAGGSERDRAARAVIGVFAIGHHDREAVHRAAQEDHHQPLMAALGLGGPQRPAGAPEGQGQCGARGEEEMSAVHRVTCT